MATNNRQISESTLTKSHNKENPQAVAPNNHVERELKKFGIETPDFIPDKFKVTISQMSPYDRYKLSKQFKIRKVSNSPDLLTMKIPKPILKHMMQEKKRLNLTAIKEMKLL